MHETIPYLCGGTAPMIEVLLGVFFKQKTAYEIKECDWSSDVCSSDLLLSNQCTLGCFRQNPGGAAAPAGGVSRPIRVLNSDARLGACVGWSWAERDASAPGWRIPQSSGESGLQRLRQVSYQQRWRWPLPGNRPAKLGLA